MKLLAIRTCLSCGDRFVLMDGKVKMAFIFPHETLVRCHQWKCDSVDVRIDIEMVPEDTVIDLPHVRAINVEIEQH